MSGFLSGFEVAASGLSAQRTRVNVVSSNLANANTTRTADGGPYLRRDPIFVSAPVAEFGDEMDRSIQAVRVSEVRVDERTPTQQVYDPSHPDADPDGYVEMPNVNVLEEMVNLVTASRSYEANATAFETLKSMAMRALQIAG